MREYLETHYYSIILKNDYFENGKLKYHQKRGFTIGTKFSPPYSNLFMTGLKKIIGCSLKFADCFETYCFFCFTLCFIVPLLLPIV